MPARMPDRRRHGAHEDRGAGRAGEEIRALPARAHGRLSAALCAARRPAAMAPQSARWAAGRGSLFGTYRRIFRTAQPATLAQRLVQGFFSLSPLAIRASTPVFDGLWRGSG